MFFLGGNHHIWEAMYRDNEWTNVGDMCDHPGSDWGCGAKSAPAVGVDSDGNQYVFWKGWDDGRGYDVIYEARYEGGWHKDGNMCAAHEWGCNITGTPAVAVEPNSHQHVFFRGDDEDIHYAKYDGGWQNEGSMAAYGWGRNVASYPAGAGVDAYGHLYVFFTGSDSNIYEAYKISSWDGPLKMCDPAYDHWGCGVSSGPGVGVNSYGWQWIFFAGGNSNVYEAKYKTGTWTNVGDMCNNANAHWGCNVATGPGAGVNNQLSIENQYVFYLGQNSNIYEAYFDSDGWHNVGDMHKVAGWGENALAKPGVAIGGD